jgi:phenylacetic acid degradation operon negative regulatory protein
MLTKPLSDAVEALATLKNQRVWSLLVTVFGDLAQNDGDVIEGPVLSVLMSDIGIKAEATRVALHRLRNDGWINSVKSGRNSLHSLTASGRQESSAASPRIYGHPNDSRAPRTKGCNASRRCVGSFANNITSLASRTV